MEAEIRFRLFGRLLFTVRRGDAALMRASKGQRMFVNTGDFEFSVPASYENITNYTFRTPDAAETLELTYIEADEDTPDIGAAMASLQQGVEMLFGAGLHTRREAARSLGIHAALQWDFAVEADAKQHQGQAVICALTPQRFLQAMYTCPAGDAAAPDRFNTMLDSLTYLGQPDKAQPPQGYVRRQAGSVALDVPAALLPPSAYLFLNAQETIRIAVQPNRLPSDEKTSALWLDTGRVLKTEPAAVASGPQMQARAVRSIVEASGAGREEYSVVYRAALVFAADVQVTVTGYAPQQEAAEMEEAVGLLAASVRHTGGGNG